MTFCQKNYIGFKFEQYIVLLTKKKLNYVLHKFRQGF